METLADEPLSEEEVRPVPVTGPVAVVDCGFALLMCIVYLSTPLCLSFTNITYCLPFVALETLVDGNDPHGVTQLYRCRPQEAVTIP